MNNKHVSWPVNYAGQTMKNGVLWTQMDTQLLFCIKANKQLVKIGKYFLDFNFHSSRLAAKYCENWKTRNFPFYGIPYYNEKSERIYANP